MWEVSQLKGRVLHRAGGCWPGESRRSSSLGWLIDTGYAPNTGADLRRRLCNPAISSRPEGSPRQDRWQGCVACDHLRGAALSSLTALGSWICSLGPAGAGASVGAGLRVQRLQEKLCSSRNRKLTYSRVPSYCCPRAVMWRAATRWKSTLRGLLKLDDSA